MIMKFDSASFWHWHHCLKVVPSLTTTMIHKGDGLISRTAWPQAPIGTQMASAQTFGRQASLKGAGFKTIDAVLPNPVNREQAYFFRGDQYVLVHIQQGESLLFALSSS